MASISRKSTSANLMPGLLISGPAGAGKTQRARQVLGETPGPAVLIEFQEIYATLLGIERLPSGRYPERLESDSFAMPLVEYTRRTAITAARERDIYAIVTNSDGNPERRTALLGYIGPGSSEVVVDPGRAAVEAALSIDDELSEQCKKAVGRWYNPRPSGSFGRRR